VTHELDASSQEPTRDVAAAYEPTASPARPRPRASSRRSSITPRGRAPDRRATGQPDHAAWAERSPSAADGAPQVGCGAYRIELAVVDPNEPTA